MKKKIMMTVITIFVLAIGVFAYTFSANTVSGARAASCSCCTGDSCPMKKKDASGKETASCCDNCDCCKGDSCPMKMKDASATAGSAQPSAAGDAKSCDCSCCKHDKGKKDTTGV